MLPLLTLCSAMVQARTMAPCWFCLLVICLACGLSLSKGDVEAVKPRNVSVTPLRPGSLLVSWVAPEKDELLESYRVRVSPAHQEDIRQVHWIGEVTGLRHHETLQCLEPATAYKVQVVTRFSKNSTLPDGYGDEVLMSTLPLDNQGFLEQVWEQRVFVLVGAGLMAVVVVTFAPFIYCCCKCCRRRKRSHRLESIRNKKGASGKKCSSSTEGTVFRDRRANAEEDRYSVDPIQGTAFWSNQAPDDTVHPRSPASQSPPPSYSRANGQARWPSIPSGYAPKGPPSPAGQDDNGCDMSDQEDYQNAPELDLYENHQFVQQALPSRLDHPEPIYGNCAF